MNRHRHAGFSLVELMVAMAISLVLFAGALSIYLSSRNTYTDNDRLSRLQESGRIALDVLSRDLRNAGYHACVRLEDDDFFNVLTNGANSMLWDFQRPVTGWNAAGALWVETGDGAAHDAALTPGAIAGNDILAVRGPLRETNTLVLNTATGNPTNAPLAIDPPAAGFAPAPGDLMMITDCEGSEIFQVTGFAANVITRDAGGMAPTNAPDPSRQFGFAVDAMILPVRAAVYWIAPSLTGSGPALWRRVNRDQPEELIEGVERLQLMYGIDPNVDGVVDRYVNAAAVVEWQDVVAVQIALLIRTPLEDGTLVDTATYPMLDAGAFDPPDDRRQRALFTTTVALRNRTL